MNGSIRPTRFKFQTPEQNRRSQNLFEHPFICNSFPQDLTSNPSADGLEFQPLTCLPRGQGSKTVSERLQLQILLLLQRAVHLASLKANTVLTEGKSLVKHAESATSLKKRGILRGGPQRQNIIRHKPAGYSPCLAYAMGQRPGLWRRAASVVIWRAATDC